MAHYYLACDLGAESGRLVLGTLQNFKLELEEIHRFPNNVQREGASLRWNIPELFAELKYGLGKVGARKLPIESISTDSWGVDYVLLDAEGEIMEPVFHYRDPRTMEGVARAHARVGREEIFRETGIQYMPINTLYQLAAEDPSRLQNAKQLLSIADAFNYLLSGNAVVETSNASTFQLYNPLEKAWATTLISRLGFPEKLFGKLVSAGTELGTLLPGLGRETGLPPIKVIATCSHDTGAAVVGVPLLANHSTPAYLSSGTWSLLGVELHEPMINQKAAAFNFTNEIGYNHTVRLLKNISGLWLVQESRRSWKEQGMELDYAQLAIQATDAEPFRSLINPAAPEFLAPGNMPGKIAEFCQRTGQPVPQNPSQFIRCILESLAFLYRHTLDQLEELTGRKIGQLHIVGGGSKNDLLNQFTADATELIVQAGPAEATAVGNILVQAMTLGHVKNLEEARQIVGNGPGRFYKPANSVGWKANRTRFESLLKG